VKRTEPDLAAPSATPRRASAVRFTGGGSGPFGPTTPVHSYRAGSCATNLHKAIRKARAASLVVTWHGRVFGVPSQKAGEGPQAQKVAGPEGSEHTPPTFVIEGVRELVEALRAA